MARHLSQFQWHPLQRRFGQGSADFLVHCFICCYCSVTAFCSTLRDPMNWSTPGFPVLHYLLFSCLQSFPASGSFPMSQFFSSGGQSIGALALASVLSVNIQHWYKATCFIPTCIVMNWFHSFPAHWTFKMSFQYLFSYSTFGLECSLNVISDVSRPIWSVTSPLNLSLLFPPNCFFLF